MNENQQHMVFWCPIFETEFCKNFFPIIGGREASICNANKKSAFSLFTVKREGEQRIAKRVHCYDILLNIR